MADEITTTTPAAPASAPSPAGEVPSSGYSDMAAVMADVMGAPASAPAETQAAPASSTASEAATVQPAQPAAPDMSTMMQAVAPMIAQAVAQAMAPVLERIAPAAALPPATPAGPAPGDVHALAQHAARAALGPHASAEAVQAYVDRFMDVTAVTRFEGAKGWDTPEAKAQIEARRRQFAEYDTNARHIAKLESEIAALKEAQQRQAQAPERERIVTERRDALASYLTSPVPGNGPDGRAVQDAALVHFPTLAGIARGDKAKADKIMASVQRLVPADAGEDWPSRVFAVLGELEVHARELVPQTTPAAGRPPSAAPPITPGQSTTVTAPRATGYSSIHDILESLPRGRDEDAAQA